MIPFSSESSFSQFVFLSLLLALYLHGNINHFTIEFPLQCLLHPEHRNLDFTLIPPSHEVPSFSGFLQSGLYRHGPLSPTTQPCFLLCHSGTHVTCDCHLSSRLLHEKKSRLGCALWISHAVSCIVSSSALF